MPPHPTTSETTNKPRAQPAMAIPLAHIVSRSSGAIRLLQMRYHALLWRTSVAGGLRRKTRIISSRPRLPIHGDAAKWVRVHSRHGRGHAARDDLVEFARKAHSRWPILALWSPRGTPRCRRDLPDMRVHSQSLLGWSEDRTERSAADHIVRRAARAWYGSSVRSRALRDRAGSPAADEPGTSPASRRFPVGKGGAAHADRLGRIPNA
jgi:hypothetical protein